MSELRQREEPIRSRYLLDSAKDAPCTLRFSVCTGGPCVSCHTSDESFGMSRKADDCSTVHGCMACHNYLDRREWIGELTREQVLERVLAAVLATQSYRIRKGRLLTRLDVVKPMHERITPARKPKSERKEVPHRPRQRAEPQRNASRKINKFSPIDGVFEVSE